jgi:hypothetical protein
MKGAKMKISELISELENVKTITGDCETAIEDDCGFYEIEKIIFEQHLNKQDKSYSTQRWVCKIKRKHYIWETREDKHD